MERSTSKDGLINDTEEAPMVEALEERGRYEHCKNRTRVRRRNKHYTTITSH